MIVVAAYVVLNEGKDSKFLEAAQKCIKETRKENGNISYNLLKSTEENSKYTFFEEWESKDSLDAHMKTSHFSDFGASIKGLLAEQLVINVYDANLVK